MSGTVVTLDSSNDIISFIPAKKFDYNNIDDYYKTVNIYKFSKEFSKKHYLPFLAAYIKSVGHDEYYEDVLRVIAFLEKAHLRALPVGDSQNWYEIDDIQDLNIAEIIFGEKSDKLKRIQNSYGGYWRFPKLKDFCYLVNPYFPTKKMREEIVASFEVLMSQYPSGMQVNKLIAAKMFNLQPDEILPGNGAAELISAFFAINQKTTGIFLPTFEEYPNRINGSLIKKFISSNEDFSYTAQDVMNFSNEVDQVLLINPDNPSGNFIPREAVLTILEAFKKENKTLVLDESFVDFTEEGNQNTFLTSDLLHRFPNLIVIKSISKSYGVPGFRLGVMASSNKEILEKIKALLPIWNINSFGEFFMQIIDKYEKEYQIACKKIVSERNLLFNELKSIALLRVIPSQANYFLCEVLGGMSSEELTQLLFSDYNILIKDCAEKDGFNKKEFVRIAVRDNGDNSKVISALKEIQEKSKM
jgi:histidinol-phosphate/aromatic aminotransferase/cobyric acid decarboxylase-like protein